MIRVSSGTASVLGLLPERQESPPTTAYLLVGGNCRNSCGFCAQGRKTAGRAGYLSRVKWPAYREEEVLPALEQAHRQGKILRGCIQVVGSPGVFPRVLDLSGRIAGACTLPLSLSASDLVEDQMKALVSAGLHSLAIPLDAAREDLYREIKGGSFREALERLEIAGRLFPGGAATHLIAGLGETEQDMTGLLSVLHGRGIRVGLFAFTPLRGTPMESCSPPELSSYRRLQVAHFLIKAGVPGLFHFARGRLVFRDREKLRALLAGGGAFRTSGCEHCNRPYYNESPRGPLYNYPRPLKDEECRRALDEALEAGPETSPRIFPDFNRLHRGPSVSRGLATGLPEGR